MRRRVGIRGLFGAALLGLILLCAVAGTVALPHDPLAIDMLARLAPPDGAHWLGTDAYGRDMLSRILSGASMSLGIALASVVLAMAIGCVLGAISGYQGGWADRVIGVAIDAMMAFPGMLLALALAAAFGGGPGGLVLALGVALSPAAARQLRATMLAVRERDFVEAARVLGQSQTRILMVQVLPNSITPLIVLSASLLSIALLTESVLSFLGLGVAPPTPTWGNMLADGRRFLEIAPWVSIYPGIAITLTILSINLVGDALRDALDPRMQENA